VAVRNDKLATSHEERTAISSVAWSKKERRRVATSRRDSRRCQAVVCRGRVRGYDNSSNRRETRDILYRPLCLSKSLERYICFGLDHPNEYELTFVTRRSKELQKPKPENKKLGKKLGMQAFGRFYDCVDAVMRAGLTNDSDTQRLTQQLWAAIHGLVVLLLLRSEFPWTELSSLISGHVTMLVSGVTKQGR
jgi:hypothetical protein